MGKESSEEMEGLFPSPKKKRKKKEKNQTVSTRLLNLPEVKSRRGEEGL